MTDLTTLEADLVAAIHAAQSLDVLEEQRVRALGKTGTITALLKTLGPMEPGERSLWGPRYNGLRERIVQSLALRKAALEQAALHARLETERVDITLPVVSSPPLGRLHPIHYVMDELIEIFADLGFSVAEGPEIETDWYNFTALNIPPEHPARAMHDTFYMAQSGEAQEQMVLRTHTSPVQIRTMLKDKPPIRIIAPGKTYRSDSDATHTPMFHQIEGLVIDTHTTMAHLRGCLETFIKAFFQVDHIVTRFRPSFFPFTEPSAELDVQCHWNNGELKVGEGKDWLEVLGCGMVHHKVITACGLDPSKYQGFAFGCGIDRLAMLKYGMTDLRAFFDADLRWLRHYGFSMFETPAVREGPSA